MQGESKRPKSSARCRAVNAAETQLSDFRPPRPTSWRTRGAPGDESTRAEAYHGECEVRVVFARRVDCVDAASRLRPGRRRRINEMRLLPKRLNVDDDAALRVATDIVVSGMETWNVQWNLTRRVDQ